MSQKATFHRSVIAAFVNLLFLFLFLPIFSQGRFNNDTSAIRKILTQSDNLYKKDNIKSFQLAKSALEASKKAKFLEGEAIANKFMARIYSNQFHFDSAVNCYNNCIQIYKQLKKKSELFNIYNKLGVVYGKQSEYNRSREYFKLAYQGAIETNDVNMMLDASHNLVIVYRYLGLWDSCLYILSGMEKKAFEVSDTSMLADCYREKAIIYEQQGKYKQALDNYYLSSDYFKSINDIKDELMGKEDIAMLYLNIHEYQKALELLKDILPGYIKNIEDYTPILNNIGMAFQGIGKPDSAMVYHRKCLELAQAHNIKKRIARSYHQIGKIYNEKGEYTQAFEVLTKSIAIYKESQMKQQYAEAINALGNTYLATRKIDMAEKTFLEAFAIGQELNALIILKDATNGLHRVKALKNNFKDAYTYALEFKTYSDSSLNIENVKNATKTELKHEFEKEKAAIAFKHSQDKLIIKRQKLLRNSIFIVLLLTIVAAYIIYRFYLRKKKADKEKEALLKEIHHRVKNNLQIVSSLLNIQSEYITDSKIIDFVHENQGRVKAMALIHQMLYQSDKFTRIDFNDYLTQLTKTLSNIYQSPRCKVDTHIVAEKVAFDIDTSIPLGLIITELMSNAYKHAFNDSKTGTIEIGLQSVAPKGYELTVSDNGKGLPDNINLENNNSMGLKLIRILTEQLDGQLKAQNNNGALFTISFSENY
jgi:two-component system, sensor histidine kinase PdtaS